MVYMKYHNAQTKLKQRSDLTFKHNLSKGRHGWFRLTPAYSIKIVDKILNKKYKHSKIIDPFSGTGTTALCAAMKGLHAQSLDINPFLVWLSKAKVARFDHDTLDRVKVCAREIEQLIASNKIEEIEPPALFNIERWWNKDQLGYLCKVMQGIYEFEPSPGPTKDLLLIAFCRTLIGLSNAAFNHQSMSFKQPREQALTECAESFERDVNIILQGAIINPTGSALVENDDARSMKTLEGQEFDLLITSPPYPNRMSYIRELRPYMYWLGYLNKAREAAELDWKAIGGTWGVATSRLSEWEKNQNVFFPKYLPEIIESIRLSDAKSGVLLANYVGKYFEDIWTHIISMVKIMKPNGEVHYIIGNSKFYDITVPSELIYSDMLKEAGMSRCEIRPIRKRNSKKELYEYDVVAWK